MPMLDSVELKRLAKVTESVVRAYFIAFTKAAGGFINRAEDYTLTIFPYDKYPVNGVLSPQFTSENAAERVEDLLRVVQEHKKDIRIKLGPTTKPPDLAHVLEARGLKRSYYLTYMAASLSQMKLDYPIAGDLTIRIVEDYEVFRQHQHPFYGLMLSPKKRLISATFQKLSERKLKKFWTFLITKSDQPVGTASLFLYRGNAGIPEFAILKQYQRQGIGTALLQHVCEFACMLDARVIGLGASTQGARFYPQFGFQHVGRYPTYFYSRKMGKEDEKARSVIRD
jgi:ribosomal protein S18 acetylase RimI-like enzyme